MISDKYALPFLSRSVGMDDVVCVSLLFLVADAAGLLNRYVGLIMAIMSTMAIGMLFLMVLWNCAFDLVFC